MGSRFKVEKANLTVDRIFSFLKRRVFLVRFRSNNSSNYLYQSLFFRLLLWKQLTEAFSFQLHLQVDFHFSKCQRSTRQGATFKRMNWTCIYQYFTHSTLLKPEGTCLMNYVMKSPLAEDLSLNYVLTSIQYDFYFAFK